MTFTYLLSGKHTQIAQEEVRGVLKSQGLPRDLSKGKRLLKGGKKPSHIKRLSMSHEVGKELKEISKEEIANFEPSFKPKERFSVRVENLQNREGIQKERIERAIGRKYLANNNSVDLESPETILKVYVQQEQLTISKIIGSIDRGSYKQRSNENRLFSSPVSLDPKLARALVNISRVKPGEQILDPFCGTGGILIEAGLCGVGVAGTDIDQEMVKGCRKNLEQYGIINHDIRQESAEKAPEAFDKDFDAIVTDLPYGRSSKKTEDIVEKFMSSIKTYDCRKIIMWNKDTLDGRNPDFSIDVHSSLTRYIYIID